MTTVLLTSFSIGRMVRCDPLPPFSLSLPARRFITRAALSLRPRITPPGPRPSLLSVLNAVRRHCSTSAPLSAAAPCPLRSPPAPFTDHAAPRQCNSPPSPLSICTASRLSVSTALRLRRSPLSPLSVLAALLPRRSSFSPFSVLTALRSVRPLSPAAPAICTLPPLAPADLLCSRLSPVTRRSKLCRVRTT